MRHLAAVRTRLLLAERPLHRLALLLLDHHRLRPLDSLAVLKQIQTGPMLR
jgi:hypothetical protein